MKHHRTLLVCSALALLIILAVALQGAPVLGGIVWVPEFAPQPAPSIAITQTPGPRASAPPAAQHITRIDLSWLALLVAVVVLGVVAILIWRAVRKRLQRTPDPDVELEVEALGDVEPAPEAEPDAPQLRRGLDRALDLLDDDREPRDAIEQAWLSLQDAAEDSGVRRLPAETPGEFAARVLARVGADRSAARTLLDLYLRARFGDAPVTSADLARATSAIEALQASWSTGVARGRSGAGGGAAR